MRYSLFLLIASAVSFSSTFFAKDPELFDEEVKELYVTHGDSLMFGDPIGESKDPELFDEEVKELYVTHGDSLMFGDPIGESNGVVAFNNIPEGFVSDELSYVFYGGDTLCTGIKGQCVEYARRWLISNLGVSFPDVDYAVDMWGLDSGVTISHTKENVAIKHFVNGSAMSLPKWGDLIIYDTSMASVTGHVAVVVKVSDGEIYVAEQNYMPGLWQEKEHSREISFSSSENAATVLRDVGVIGWLRFI